MTDDTWQPNTRHPPQAGFVRFSCVLLDVSNVTVNRWERTERNLTMGRAARPSGTRGLTPAVHAPKRR
jgi:hypothetical protein